MKCALIVNEIKDSMSENLKIMIDYINQAADQGADLVLFPETALTGLINIDEKEHDLKLGVSIPGAETDQLCEVARKRKINLAVGLFEVDGDYLYDSAIFITREGTIGLKYRRGSRGWHGSRSESYCKEGTDVGSFHSDFGEICFLICGDVNNEYLTNEVSKRRPDYLLFPFARSFEDESYSQDKWDKEEMDDYRNKFKAIGVTTFMTNYIDQYCFGGAYAISETGEVLGSLPLGEEGMLIVEV